MVRKISFIALALLAIPLILLGLSTSQQTPAQSAPDPAAELEHAESYHRVWNYQPAEAGYKAVYEKYPGTEYALDAYKKLIHLYVELAKDQQAEVTLQQLLADFADRPDETAAAVLYIADECVWSERYQKARELFQYILDNWPGQAHEVGAWAGLAVSNLMLGDTQDAEAAIEKLFTEFADHPDAAEQVCNLPEKCRDLDLPIYDKAIELYQRLLDNWPQSESAIWAQAGIAISNAGLGNMQAADAAFNELTTEFSEYEDLPAAVRNVAEEFLWLKRYEKAKELFQYILHTWPESEYAVWAQAGVAASNITLGDDSNAQAAFDTLLADFSTHPDLPEALYGAAELCVQEKVGQYRQAQNIYQQIIQHYPDSSYATRARLGVPKCQILFHIDAGDDAAALAGIDSLIADFKGHPDLPTAISRIEEQYYLKTRAAESPDSDYFYNSIEVWEKAINGLPGFFYPGDFNLYYFIADCYRQVGQYEKAIEYYGIVADKWTRNGYAILTDVGVPMVNPDTDDYEAVHSLIDSLIANFGNHPGLAGVILRIGQEYLDRAVWYEDQGLDEEARDHYLKAITLWDRAINELPSSVFSATTCYFLADSSRQLGEHQAVIDYSETLVQNWPDYEYVEDAQYWIEDCYKRLSNSGK